MIQLKNRLKILQVEILENIQYIKGFCVIETLKQL